MTQTDATMATDMKTNLKEMLQHHNSGVVRLNEKEVTDLLCAAGVTSAQNFDLDVNAEEEDQHIWCDRVLAMSQEHGRFVLKILGRDLLHKSDVGGVKMVDVDETTTPNDLMSLVKAMYDAVRNAGAESNVEGVLACEFTPHHANTPGAEVLLSLRQDHAFGPVVVISIGGVLTEWYGQSAAGRSRLILPARGLTLEGVQHALLSHPVLSILCQQSRLHPVPPITPEHFAQTVMALASLADQFAADREGPTLEEIEINPAVASAGRLVAIDGVGTLSSRASAHQPRPLHRINHLLAPRSAVILGVSAKGMNPGRVIMNNLKASPGVDHDQLYVIHAHEKSIDDIPCFKAMAALPQKVDLAVVCIPAEGARDAIKDIVHSDLAESIILIPGGFAEAGHTELAEAIEDSLVAGHRRPQQGPVMVGGNCLGIVSRDQYNTFFLPEYKLPFHEAEAGDNLAVVSQSGAYLVTFASNYDGMINPRASISFGNQMDLTVSDFLEHFLTVDEVDVVACYVEGFKDGDGVRFLDAARRARRQGTSVLMFKAGKTALGAKAAASHTASLAGDYDVAVSCFEDAGVIVAETLDEFEDLIKTFTLLKQRTVSGRRVGIMSNAGFECSTVMDAMDGLELQPFEPDVRLTLDEVLPSFAHRDNPIDATPMANTAAYAASLRAILASEAIDCALISSVPVTPALNNLPASAEHREDLSGVQSQAAQFIEIIQASTKPTVLVVDSGPLYDPLVTALACGGVPVFRKIDRAARSLSCYLNAVGDVPDSSS
jgi:acyl-CoA synthetase (NDP forming)